MSVYRNTDGTGGQGKSELAVAYAHAFADCYPAGLWALRAESKKELLPLIGELAFDPALGYVPTDAEKNDPPLLGKAVLNHLKSRADAVRDPLTLPSPPREERVG